MGVGRKMTKPPYRGRVEFVKNSANRRAAEKKFNGISGKPNKYKFDSGKLVGSCSKAQLWNQK